MNRLGGVGAGRSQYKIRGLNHPDGARRCKPYRFGHQASYIEILLGDVMKARGGDQDAENELLGKHQFLSEVINGVVEMMGELLFKPAGGEVLLHLEPLAALVATGIPPELIGGAPVGHILGDIAGRLRVIASDSGLGGNNGVISLSDFKTVMENSKCPVFRSVLARIEAKESSLGTLGLSAPMPDVNTLLSYFAIQSS
jgi:hypothetical protein